MVDKSRQALKDGLPPLTNPSSEYCDKALQTTRKYGQYHQCWLCVMDSTAPLRAAAAFSQDRSEVFGTEKVRALFLRREILLLKKLKQHFILPHCCVSLFFVQFWLSDFKKYLNQVETIQRTAMGMVEGLEGKIQTKRLKQLFNLEVRKPQDI